MATQIYGAVYFLCAHWLGRFFHVIQQFGQMA